MQKFYLTKPGLDKFTKELEQLKSRRPQVAESIASAREQGDLSENSEYQSAKEEQGILENRIEELENILKNSCLIDESQPHSTMIVGLGSTVYLKNLQNSAALVFNIVGTMEADPFENKISDESPIGKVLIGKKIGEEVALPKSDGKIICRIVAIE